MGKLCAGLVLCAALMRPPLARAVDETSVLVTTTTISAPPTQPAPPSTGGAPTSTTMPGLP